MLSEKCKYTWGMIFISLFIDGIENFRLGGFCHFGLFVGWLDSTQYKIAIFNYYESYLYSTYNTHCSCEFTSFMTRILCE